LLQIFRMHTTRMDRRPLPKTHFARAARSRPIQIVVTPGSGKGEAMATALALGEVLRGRGYRSQLEVFSNLESLGRWGNTEDRDFPLLICVGGDGTQSAAACAAVHRSVPFLTVSSGFGNLFARALAQPRTVDGVLDLLDRGRVMHCDVGMRNGELFLCQESYGPIAEIQNAVEVVDGAPRARWRRAFAYYAAAVRHLRQTHPTRLRVTVDGRVVALDAALVIVANVKTYGPWLPLVPDASPIDGLLDVFIMQGVTQRQVFATLLRRHLRIPGAGAGSLLCRGQRVLVSGVHRDRLEVLPHRLPVVVSPETAAALERDLTGRENHAFLAEPRAA
jgi:diacylglycerol kinase (ATP)